MRIHQHEITFTLRIWTSRTQLLSISTPARMGALGARPLLLLWHPERRNNIRLRRCFRSTPEVESILSLPQQAQALLALAISFAQTMSPMMACWNCQRILITLSGVGRARKDMAKKRAIADRMNAAKFRPHERVSGTR